MVSICAHVQFHKYMCKYVYKRMFVCIHIHNYINALTCVVMCSLLSVCIWGIWRSYYDIGQFRVLSI